MIKQLNTVSKEEAKQRGYGVFSNTSETPHTLLDVTKQENLILHLINGDEMKIIVGKPSKDGGRLRFEYIQNGDEEVMATKAIGFENGRMKDLLGERFELVYGNPKEVSLLSVQNPIIIDLANEGEHTISLKLPNGNSITICSIPFITYDGGKSGTFDIKFHELRTEQDTVLKAFAGTEETEMVADLYTVDYRLA